MLTIAGYLAIGLAVLSIAGHLPAWLAVRRVYGRFPFSLVRQMLAYAVRSPGAQFGRWLWGIIVIWLGLEAACMAGYLPIPPRLVLLGVTLFLTDCLATCALPPSVLFLSGSAPAGIASLSQLCKGLWPYRAVALLRPTTDWPDPETGYWFFFGCLRTNHTYEWRTEVYHLMDVVPLIVIDQRGGTAGVLEEWDRIQAKGFLDRTIHLNGPLDPTQIEQIRNRLEQTNDCEERHRRQVEFTSVVGMLSPHVRFERSLYHLVLRSRELGQQEYERYLRRCKGITPAQVAGRLLEDIPSIVTLAEEERFLRESRPYDEVGILLRSALEAVQDSTEPTAPYNAGNCLNNLGKLARNRWRWEEAIDYLTRALEHFRLLGETPPILQEMAIAHLLLGETYLARSRTSSSQSDRVRAREHLNQSLAIDLSLGVDGASTRQLLNVLERPEETGTISPPVHPLREPTFWDRPIVVMTTGVVAALLAYFPSIFVAGWLLGLPANWLTFEGWESLSSFQRFGTSAIAGTSCFVIMILVMATLKER